MRPAIGILLLLAVGLAIGASVHFGGLQSVVNDASSLAVLIDRAGPSAPIAFVVVFALLNAFGFPGLLLVGAAVMSWSLPAAFLLSWLGGLGAGLVAIGFTHVVGREWVASRLPARWRAYDERLAARPLRTVMLIRLVFFLNPLSHWFLALSRVSFTALLLGTALGLLPGMAFTSIAGESTLDWLLQQPAWVWLAGAAAVTIAFLFYRRRLQSRRVGAAAPR